MDPNKALKFAMLAGEIMLSSGAETYRVEDIIKRILYNCGFQTSESFVTPTGFFASVEDKEEGIITLVKRVITRVNNFEKIVLVNNLSRAFEKKEIDIDQAILMLNEINIKPPYPIWLKILATGIVCSTFTYTFGGNVFDSISAFPSGIILQIFLIKLQRKNVTSVLKNIICGAIITLVALFMMNIGIGRNIDKIIIGSIMPLVPGLGLTNAMRDILEGDYISGTARTVDAIIVAVAIATGVGTILKTWLYFAGGVLI